MEAVRSPVTPQPSAAAKRLPLRVALATSFIPPHQLAVFRELAERVERLVVLLSTKMEADRPWPVEWGGLDVRVQRTLTLGRSYRDASGSEHQAKMYVPWDMQSQLRQLRPDVIVSSSLGFRSSLCGLYKAFNPRTALVLWAALSERSESKWESLRPRLRRVLVRRADAFLVNGDSCARYLDSLGCERSRMFHGPYVAVPDLFERVPLERPAARAHRLLYAGRLLRLKGLLPFFEALNRWASRHRDRRVEFDLVGAGPLEKELRAFPREPNVTIEFLPERPLHELPSTYANAGIFVFPSFDDEWGLVVNEAMAAGLPVLGSVYSQAADELCDEGRTGWRFRPDDAASLDAALETALSTAPAKLLEMRLAARERVAGLTPRHLVDNIIEAMLAALSRCRPGFKLDRSPPAPDCDWGSP